MSENPYTIQNLLDVEDMAAKHGLSETGEARFAKEDLEAEDTGVSLQSLKPNARQSFGHKHDKAEEVYVVLSGSGRVKLDDDIKDVKERDAVRVSPGVTRAWEAGDQGIEILAFGPRHEGDGDMVPDWWKD